MFRTFWAPLIAGVLFSMSSVPAFSQDSGEELDQLIDQKLDEYTRSEQFQQRVEQVIVQFIQKQGQARAEQERKARMEKLANVAPVDPETDHIRGPKEAAFTLIEYSDYECPYCKRFHATAKALLERNQDVNWVYRHFPLNFHNPGAQKEAEAAECVASLGGNDAFWRYSDIIFERTTSNGKGFPTENLGPLAEEIGLDRKAFDTCLESGRFKDKVIAQANNGQESGVTGTPGNFLRHNASGQMLPISGAQPLNVVEGALKKMRDTLE
jgi:protein-disulfide isomerase